MLACWDYEQSAENVFKIIFINGNKTLTYESGFQEDLPFPLQLHLRLCLVCSCVAYALICSLISQHWVLDNISDD